MDQNTIDRMSIRERVESIEQLWESLLPNEGEVGSPGWHEDILAERRRKIESGEAKFLSLAELRKLRSA